MGGKERRKDKVKKTGEKEVEVYSKEGKELKMVEGLDGVNGGKGREMESGKKF